MTRDKKYGPIPKRWKPGQVITINNHVYRVVVGNPFGPVCLQCEMQENAYLGVGPQKEPCKTCLKFKMPSNCYLKQVL